MTFVLHTFLKLFLVASLAAFPMVSALASVGSGHGMSMHDSDHAEPCHEMQHDQGTAEAHAGSSMPASSTPDSSMKEPCSCCGIDCGCPDGAGCNSVAAPLVSALPGMPLAAPDLARDVFAVALQSSYLSLDSPPDSPPPVV